MASFSPRSSKSEPSVSARSVSANMGARLQIPQFKFPRVHFSRYRTAAFAKYWFKPFVALIIYTLTFYIAAAAPTRSTVLGRVSAPVGTWFLTMLAKAGDIAFAFAVEDMFDTMTWRYLKYRRNWYPAEDSGTIRLDLFLALMSSTGVEGLFRILRRSIKWGRRWAGINSSGGWSLIRLIFLMALIPGPGIILMANVTQKNVFFDERSMNISAGLAQYNPDLANATRVRLGPVIARLLQSMLRDRSLSWPVDPVGEGCKADKFCKSLLLAGPYMTVAPWPFINELEGFDGFRVNDAPFYQVEVWSPGPEKDLSFSESRDCTVYGGFNKTTEFSTIMCIKNQDSNGTLVAGWKSCQEGVAENGTCLSPGALPGWSTNLLFYRRRATVVFSRTEFTIQEVTNLSHPELQMISPASLFQSIDTILYKPNSTFADYRSDFKSQEYVLTQDLGSNLWQSLYNQSSGLTIGKDWLQNMLTLPVYLFQATMISSGPLAGNGTSPAPDLPPENYVKGAYCLVDNRAIPGWGTVVGYACVAGLVLMCVIIGKAVAMTWPDIETSEYGMLDYEILTALEDSTGSQTLLSDRFLGRAYDEDKLMNEIVDLKIGLRDP
ncbi:hypothetical protein BS50DRAFT_671117 [Corynespora cassiicola Philippines]|uniref:Uncharacterized protein n=1 Tax=Corynespora cassiicola Philippines TaxID=1448308 RepID=A0A2T2PAW8_CORCC|nr:hypothetical protein BS50DRAFT_671117 [Corynespora cassiicola Philippines]